MSYAKLTDFAAKDALLSGNPSKLLRGTEIGAEFDAIESAMAAAEAVNITSAIIAASTSKTTPVDADVLPILDSAAANILKKVTWVNIKATLKTYFDTLYPASGTYALPGANADITSLTALTAGGLPDNSVLTADIANGQVTPNKLSQPLTLGASAATTSGTSVAITGIPSWAKRITLQLLGVSTNGGSQLMVQLGDSGGVETTGYLGGAATSSSSVTSTASDSAGFILEAGGAFTAASIRYGHIVLTLSDASNTWSMSSVTALTAGNVVSQAAGGKQTSAALDRISLTTVGGTEAFDSGSINILYE